MYARIYFLVVMTFVAFVFSMVSGFASYFAMPADPYRGNTTTPDVRCLSLLAFVLLIGSGVLTAVTYVEWKTEDDRQPDSDDDDDDDDDEEDEEEPAPVKTGKGCPLDTDGDGNCPRHPNGCPPAETSP